MGMSASQARMLSLTARLSDLELSAQQISNAKIRLSDQGAQASQVYSDALNKQTMTVYAGLQDNSSTSNYINASAANLTTYCAVSDTDKQRFIKDSSGKVLVTDEVANAIKTAAEAAGDVDTYNDCNDYLDAKLGGHAVQNANSTSTPPKKAITQAQIAAYTEIYTAYETTKAADTAAGYDEETAKGDGTYSAELDAFLQSYNVVTDKDASNYDSGAVTYYTNVFNEIAENGYKEVGDDSMSSSEWLQNGITTGTLFLSEYKATGGADGTGDYENVSWTSGDSSLQEKTDSSDTAKAEAQYETTMASIQSKDKRFDMELTTINTEHTAIQTEIDSVKKVIDKNIERSFKIFDA